MQKLYIINCALGLKKLALVCVTYPVQGPEEAGLWSGMCILLCAGPERCTEGGNARHTAVLGPTRKCVHQKQHSISTRFQLYICSWVRSQGSGYPTTNGTLIENRIREYRL